jgi:RES domain-containing protein
LIEAYRISKELNPAKAFSGQGAKDWGGRWSSRGVAVVYTAAHRSLSILEVLVHVKGVSAARSAILAVPSVIVPEERNYVLNPNHPRFPELQIGSPVACSFDPRLL